MLKRAHYRLSAFALSSRPAVFRNARLASFKTQNAQPPKIANAKYVPTRTKHDKKQHTADDGPESDSEPQPVPHSTETTDWARHWRIAVLVFKLAVGGVLAVHIFFEYFFVFNATYGVSMLPTISSYGDWIWISKIYRRGRWIEVGDLVSFKNPTRLGEDAVKRVTGMEGDFVLMNTPGKNDDMIQVPQGHCWVVGDNMEHSRDSRMFGPLPLALINGKVVARGFFSPSRFQPGLQDCEESNDFVD